jgi:signal transduction histidine kinase
MTIRRKLFAAFLGVVAVPLVMTVALAQSYLRRTRADLDKQFLDEAHRAIARSDVETNVRLERLRAAAHALATELIVRGDAAPEASEPPVPPTPAEPPVPPVPPVPHVPPVPAVPPVPHVPHAHHHHLHHSHTQSTSGSNNNVNISIDVDDDGDSDEDSDDESDSSDGDHGDDLDKSMAKLDTTLDHLDIKLDKLDKLAKLASLAGLHGKARHSIAIALRVAQAAAQLGNGTKVKVPDESPHLCPQESMSALVHRFRAEHPEVLGVKIASDKGGVEYDDLVEDIAFNPNPSVANRVSDYVIDGRHYLYERIPEVDAWCYLQVDPAAVVAPARVFKRGWAFHLDPASPALPFQSAGEQQQLMHDLPFAAIVQKLPPHGEVAMVKAPNGDEWSVYRAVASEATAVAVEHGIDLIAVACHAELYGPLVRFSLGVYSAIFITLLLAVGLSYLLSGRFVGAVENIKRGVDAISRGEWAQIEKLSSDELGGGLVESMNKMAIALAERTRREEIEGWRRLVRVLSHEINNTLGPVRSAAATVRDQIAGRIADDDAAEDLHMAFRLIVDRTDALTAFIAGYAELAKLPEPVRADADLVAVCSGAAEMLRAEADARHVALVEDHDHLLEPISIDRAQIERVAINLIKNAVEAAHGRVVVATAQRGDSVELTVEDDGPGIAPEARRHLFVPYFTTKKGGSGIGLALVRQIVLGHGGTVTAEDREGGGTRMRVTLPRGEHS